MINLQQQYTGHTLHLQLQGDWTLVHGTQARQLLGSGQWRDAQQIVLDTASADSLDVSTAWLVYQQVQRWRQQLPVELRGFPPEFERYFSIHVASDSAAHTPVWRRFFIRLGKQASGMLAQLGLAVVFLGHIASGLMVALRHPGLLRVRSIFHHVFAAGISAVPIIAMVACLISIVITYQGGGQLKALGAAIYTVDMVALSVLRELGVMLTSIMVAGRSGSAFAAEIGLMKTNQEIDALQVMGSDPFMILVLPRVLALMLALPLLTLLADIIAMLAAALISPWVLDISVGQFFARVQTNVPFETFAAGLIKAPFFALGIALVGCRQGMQVSGSAESLGEHTTRAVVESIALVLLLDAAFSIVFYRLGF